MRLRRVLIRVCCAGAVTLVGVHAQSAPIALRQGDVAVLHGGVGAEERAAMTHNAADYNLRLTFAAKGSGAYLAGVKVTIRNARGDTVLDTIAAGPWLFARLPQGTFSVAARVADQTLTQTLSIPIAGHRDWVFRFDAPALP